MANNQNTTTQKLQYATDYKLEALTLTAPALSNTDLDLMPYMLELNYFEDLFNNTISGSVVISDAVGILNFSQVSGTEYIHVKLLKSDGIPSAIDRVFRVYAITDRRFDTANNNEIYKLEFCSEEYLVSDQYRISKSYSGVRVSQIIADICTDTLKIGAGNNSKQLNIDDTVGIKDFVLPNKKPLETINWLANYAVPAKYPNGADMLFFENNMGYFFTSLQHMFQTNSIFKYAYNPKNVTSDPLKNMTNVLSFEVVRYIDTLDAINKGTFGNRIVTVDPLRRKKTTTDFNYNNYQQQSISLNGSPITNNYKNKLGKSLYDPPPKTLEAGALRMMISNANQQSGGAYTKNKPGTVQNDFEIEKVIPHRVAQMALATSTVLKLTVPGNPAITVGTCIDFTVASSNPLNSKQTRPIDPYLSGKYLISAARHIISPASYICIVEICKDSALMNYAAVDTTNPSWNNLVKGNQK